MAMGCVGLGVLDSLREVRIHYLNALNSWREALGSGSLQVRNKSECVCVFEGLFLWSLKGLKAARVIFLPSFKKEYIFS